MSDHKPSNRLMESAATFAKAMADHTGEYAASVRETRRCMDDLGLTPKLIDHDAPREMTGFFAGLTDEQKAAALSYDGPESHGDAALLRRDAVAQQDGACGSYPSDTRAGRTTATGS